MTIITVASGPGAAAGIAQGGPIAEPDEGEPGMFRGSSIERFEHTPRHAVAAALRALADDVENGEPRIAAIDVGSTLKQSGAGEHVVRIAFSTKSGWEMRFGRRS